MINLVQYNELPLTLWLIPCSQGATSGSPELASTINRWSFRTERSQTGLIDIGSCVRAHVQSLPNQHGYLFISSCRSSWGIDYILSYPVTKIVFNQEHPH
jgi:hypothetical protein